MIEFSAEVIKNTRDKMGLTLYRLLEAVAHYQMVLSRLEKSGADFCKEHESDIQAIESFSEEFLARVDRLLKDSQRDQSSVER